ncbi:MAG: GDSL-type esterase/lipase family protein [bacterium]|nr:GDSL-type esterase/lipase family protein [bacterium]
MKNSHNETQTESPAQSGLGRKAGALLKPVVFLSLPLVIFLALLHFGFMALVAIEDVPEFNFQFALTGFGQMGADLEDSDEIVVLPPNSYFRKSMPHGLSLSDNQGNSITHYHGVRRNQPFEKEKGPGIKRVLTIGDSFTWGAGLSDEQTFPAMLEERLNASLPAGARKVEVLNAGIVSSTITNSYESLINHDLAFKPDVVVLTFCDNDISDLASDTSISPGLYEFLRKGVWFGPIRYFFGKSIQQRRRSIVESVHTNEGMDLTGGRFGVKAKATHINWPEDVPAFMKSAGEISTNDIDKLLTLYYYSTTAWIMPFTGPDQKDTWALWKQWEDELLKIKALGQEHNFEVVVHVYPIFARIYEAQFDDQKTPEKIIREIAERNDIRVVDPLKEFRRQEAASRAAGQPLYFYPEDSHPTAAGSRIVAAELEPVLREMLASE